MDTALTALIVDDDSKLTELLAGFLASHGWKTITAGTPDEGVALAGSAKPAVVILDVMLPGRDGFAVCREIRAQSDVPILMLTARGEIADRLKGLDGGADDYLPKPFEPRELLARLRAITRRASPRAAAPGDGKRRFGELMIDYLRREVHIGQSPLELTTTEFNALRLFTDNPGRTLTRDALMDGLRGVDWNAFGRSVDILVSRLRQKLGDDPKHPRFIRTVWGEGYIFIAEETA